MSMLLDTDLEPGALEYGGENFPTHLEPDAPEYGDDSFPSAFRRLKLETDLHEFLLCALDCPEAGLAESGFAPEVESESSCSAVPSHVAYYASLNLDVDAAPRLPAQQRPLLAFVEAFRRENAGWLRAAVGGTPLEAAVGQLFAEGTAQLHFGSPVRGRNLAWHVDGESSVLHLSITLLGSRTLLAQRSSVPGGRLRIVAAPQLAGDVYVANPCCFAHAVEFPEADWAQRSLSVQCRVAGFGAEHRERWPETVAQVAERLTVAAVRLPCLADVRRVLDEISPPMAVD